MVKKPKSEIGGQMRARKRGETPAAGPTKRPGEVGIESVKHVMVRMPRDMHRDLRQLAFNEDTSLQALLTEAVQKLLAERR